MGSNQENTISFTWTHESGSIQITSEIEEYDESISKYAYIQEAEEENMNPVATISTTINGIPVNEQFLNLEQGDIASLVVRHLMIMMEILLVLHGLLTME